MIDLKIDVKTEDNVALIRTEGYLNHHNAEQLAAECEVLIKRGYKNFVMNLSGSKIINKSLSMFSRLSDKKARKPALLARLSSGRSKLRPVAAFRCSAVTRIRSAKNACWVVARTWCRSI